MTWIDQLKEALDRKVFWRAPDGKIEMDEVQFDTIATAARAMAEGKPLWWCEEHKDWLLNGICRWADLDYANECRMVSGVFVVLPEGEQ